MLSMRNRSPFREANLLLELQQEFQDILTLASIWTYYVIVMLCNSYVMYLLWNLSWPKHWDLIFISLVRCFSLSLWIISSWTLFKSSLSWRASSNSSFAVNFGFSFVFWFRLLNNFIGNMFLQKFIGSDILGPGCSTLKMDRPRQVIPKTYRK